MLTDYFSGIVLVFLSRIYVVTVAAGLLLFTGCPRHGVEMDFPVEEAGKLLNAEESRVLEENYSGAIQLAKKIASNPADYNDLLEDERATILKTANDPGIIMFEVATNSPDKLNTLGGEFFRNGADTIFVEPDGLPAYETGKARFWITFGQRKSLGVWKRWTVIDGQELDKENQKRRWRIILRG